MFYVGDKAVNMDGVEVKKTSSKTLGSTPNTLAVVIAKYDYDSHVFSPNDPDEELSFKKGTAKHLSFVNALVSDSLRKSDTSFI